MINDAYELNNGAASGHGHSSAHAEFADSRSAAEQLKTNGGTHETTGDGLAEEEKGKVVTSHTGDEAPAAAEQPAEEAPADSGNGDPMDTQEMEVGTSSEGNAHQDHASSDASKACEEPSKPSGGAAVDQPSSGSKAKEEDSSTTFECPEPACGGKIVMNDDLCRFGHGLMIRCEGGKTRHRFKWCNEHYTFIPTNEWPVHLSWCYQDVNSHASCVDASQLEQLAATSHPAAPAEEEGLNGAADSEHAGSKRKEPEKPENGKRLSTRSSIDEKDSAEQEQDVEMMDEDVNEKVRAILKENRHAILCGDSSKARHWNRQLREHRGRTLVLEMQSRASLSADKGDATTGMFVSAMRGDLERLSALIEDGGDVTVADRSDNTPLHWAAAAGSVEVGRLLLDAGAEVNAKGAGQSTPLHVAASQGRVGFVNLLLARGADLDVHNEEGLSARHLINLLAERTPG